MVIATQNPTTLAIGGERTSGPQVRQQNVMAVQAVANVVKSSLGPVGLDKMLVDDIGDVTITNDGATILSLLEVQHPAAKVLVDLAQQQDTEVGDGTTSVVILASELLARAHDLVKLGVHPTTVITGYRLALKEACKFIQNHLTMQVNSLGKACLINAAKTSLASKIIGGSDNFFAELAVDAVVAIQSTSSKGEIKCPITAINILKAHGQSQKQSQLIQGYALNCTVASQAMKKRISHAKIACLDMNLQKTKMSLGVQVVIEDPNKLEDIRKREIEITTERIQKIIQSGANVILTTKGIDDMSLKLFVESGAMAVRRCKKEDLKRIARTSGATLISTLSNLEGEESFDPSYLGQAELVEQIRIGDNECLVLKGLKNGNAASVILRGANDFMLEEMERSLHDALSVVKRTLESNRVVVGGGAVEVATSIYLDNFATTLGSREQLAVSEFANTLLVIPKILAINAAKDATDLVAKLRAYHNASQVPDADESRRSLKWTGLDLFKGDVRNNLEAGVLEPALCKIKALKAATEAAISILRIDDRITLHKEEKNDKDPHGDLH